MPWIREKSKKKIYQNNNKSLFSYLLVLLSLICTNTFVFKYLSSFKYFLNIHGDIKAGWKHLYKDILLIGGFHFIFTSLFRFSSLTSYRLNRPPIKIHSWVWMKRCHEKLLKDDSSKDKLFTSGKGIEFLPQT